MIAVIKNTGIPKLTLNKKHNSNNYHIVCKSVATKMMRIAKKIRILILLMPDAFPFGGNSISILESTWVRNSIWSIIILYANLLQLDTRIARKIQKHLLSYCIQIKWALLHIFQGSLECKFERCVLLSGFPSCQAYGEHILAYLRIDI